MKAYFAGGCFWCVTPIYKMYGVDKVVCGYSGGDEPNPTYEDVKAQKTGHRETIMLEYDPGKVSYDRSVRRRGPVHRQGLFLYARGILYLRGRKSSRTETHRGAFSRIRQGSAHCPRTIQELLRSRRVSSGLLPQKPRSL